VDKKTRANEGWLAGRMKSLEFKKSFERHGLADDFIAAIEAVMVREGISRSQLAERMGCKPANVTRAMRNTTNLTIATMVEMAFSLDCRVRVWIQPMSAISADAMPVTANFASWAEQTKLNVDMNTEAAGGGASAPPVLQMFCRTGEADASPECLAA